MRLSVKYRDYFHKLGTYLAENAPSYFTVYYTAQEARENVHEHVKRAVREYFSCLQSGDTEEQAEEQALITLFAVFNPLPEDYYFNEFLDNKFRWFYELLESLDGPIKEGLKKDLLKDMAPVLKTGFEIDLMNHHHLIDEELYRLTSNYLKRLIKGHLVEKYIRKYPTNFNMSLLID